MGALEVRDVSFSVGTKTIVDSVSLEVASGETVALLGPSGSGKTTLLRLISGLDTPTGGSIHFDGADITGVRAHRRGFGLMFQDHGLFPHLDTAANVGFGLRKMDGPAKRARIRELLDLVGLAGFEARKIDKLSGGERQRVALARALAPSPRLLMLDEPLASLDRGLRQRLVGELREILARLDIPALYVTHDQMEAFALADRVAIMDGGRLVRQGTAREIWDDPGTEFVARFLGMENIVDGVRDAEGMVATAFGTFGPLPGPEGEVRLLLREEGAEVVGAPGLNVATGVVQSATFQGAETVIQLRNEASQLRISVPDSSAAAAVPLSVAIQRVQELDSG